MTQTRPGVCAVVVTFQPDREVLGRLDLIRDQVDHVIVVDNNSGESGRISGLTSPSSRFELLANSRNLGVAAALNIGVQRAAALGFRLVLTMDQDSLPRPGMVDALLRVYATHPERELIALVAPQVDEPAVEKRPTFVRRRKGYLFERRTCTGDWLDDITMVISSGSMLATSVYQAIGPFRENLFIDYVDTEYCLRAWSRGYKIVAACEARLEHRLGDKRRVSWGPFVFYPTRYSPSRWYYISRNRMPMLYTYSLRFPHWFAFEVTSSLYGMLRMLLTEDQRMAKLAAFFRGTRDGLRGRMGPMPGSPEERNLDEGNTPRQGGGKPGGSRT
jgi:rhamnosyltransferase